jgi:outer membrane scaffolding protein for murein synthesis (MipA/OmpV family)
VQIPVGVTQQNARMGSRLRGCGPRRGGQRYGVVAAISVVTSPKGVAMRLTKKVRQELLDQNDGFETTTHFSSKNFTETRRYRISDGELHIRSTGKTSWADSHFDEDSVADDDQTRRFLRNFLGLLETGESE